MYILIVISLFGTIFSSSIYFTSAMLFLLGCTASATGTISFVNLIEVVVPEYRVVAGSLYNISGYIQPFMISIYFKFISNTAQYILVLGQIFTIASVII